MTTIENLAEATPAEIDSELARIWADEQQTAPSTAGPGSRGSTVRRVPSGIVPEG